MYRVRQIKYEYSAGDDNWTSPYARENGEHISDASFDHRRNMPSPHVSFQKRVLQQDIQYDWLGNTSTTDDDAHGFYDRSLGTTTSTNGKPYQLASATNASKGGNRTGSLNAKYDVAGNLTDMAVNRTLTGDAACLPSGSGCNQTFHYQWDEVGRLVRAQRWDIATAAVNLGTIPTGTPPADLTYTYDASDNRVLKSATAKESNVDVQRHSVYISGGQELRGAQFGAAHLDAGATGADYQIDSKTEIAYLFAHGVRLGRVAYDNGTGMPAYTANAVVPAQHVLINLDDTLGSTSIVIDRATSELVEASSYLAHGATESDYRPDRWNGLREDYRFTGKEEDVEVGLQYFGKRFLSPYLNRWVSADPLAVHSPGQADLNLFAYVHGLLLKSIDPVGLDAASDASAGGSNGADPNGGVEGNSAVGGGSGSSLDSANSIEIRPAQAFASTAAEREVATGTRVSGTGTRPILAGARPTNAFEAGLAGVYNAGVRTAAGVGKFVANPAPEVTPANVQELNQVAQWEHENTVEGPADDAPYAERAAYTVINHLTDIVLTFGALVTGRGGVLLADAEGSAKMASVISESGAARGGTYKLTDPGTGQVRRTGRTNDLVRREGEHARGTETRDLDFEVDRRTDSYAAQRGREQRIWEQHPEADLNRKQPISRTNPRREVYLGEGDKL